MNPEGWGNEVGFSRKRVRGVNGPSGEVCEFENTGVQGSEASSGGGRHICEGPVVEFGVDSVRNDVLEEKSKVADDR